MKKLKTFFKILFRGGGFNLAKTVFYKDGDLTESIFDYQGLKIHHRPNFGDRGMIHEYLLKPKKKYFIPHDLFKPSVIVDVGANTGTASAYFRSIWPEAQIYAIEPAEINFRVLKKNAESFGKMEPIKAALGDHDGVVHLVGSKKDNASLSLKFDHKNPDYSEEVPLRSLKSIMEEHQIGRINLLKLDCEGAEHDIIKSLSDQDLANIDWIVGELHGVDNDYALLARLNQFFHIDGRKMLHGEAWKFHAVNRTLLPRLGIKWNIKALQW